MISLRENISLQLVKEKLIYDSDTGIFCWATDNKRGVYTGARAGCVNKSTGYRQVRLNKQTIREHRLAWFYFYGEWPTGHLDHINGSKTDNSIANLRSVSAGENNQNKNSKGYTYSKNDDKWKAYIGIAGKRQHLGYYKTEQEASLVYKEAKARLHIKGAYNA
jgi:hypothetical protein